MVHEFYFEVRGYELDSFGHVNNSIYLNYLEEARWQFLKEINLFEFFKSNDLFPVILETNIKYLHELKMFDSCIVNTEWSYRNQYIYTNHIIYRKTDNKKVCRSESKIAIISKERVIWDIPDLLKEKLD